MVDCGGRFLGTVGSCQDLWLCCVCAFRGLTSDKKSESGTFSVFAENHHILFRRVKIGSVNPNLTGIREDGPDFWSEVDRRVRVTCDIENFEHAREAVLEHALELTTRSPQYMYTMYSLY